MNLARATGPKEATFDLTPMIDVVLLLIIFFMLSAQFARLELKPMDLPKEEGHDVGDDSPSTVVIDLDRDGSMRVYGHPASIEDLRPILAPSAALGATSTLAVVVRADRLASAAHLNRLAETLVSMGIRSWRLSTTPPGLRHAQGAPK